MKINPGFRPLKSDVTTGEGAARPVQQKSFSEVIQHHNTQASQEELTRRMKEIQLQGDRLARSMTIRELRLYKTMVKRFMEDTVRRGVAMKEARGFDRRGRGKRYKLIDELDAALLAMADELLETEQGKIELLEKMGEIRGMLINLFY